MLQTKTGNARENEWWPEQQLEQIQHKCDTLVADMEFVQKFTPLDFQVKNFTPSILPNFNSFSKKKTQKMSENGEIYTAGKNFTLPPALTGWTNSTSGLEFDKDMIYVNEMTWFINNLFQLWSRAALL